MNSLYETEDIDERQEAELTLGTGTLLAIFFGLVVVCAVFFGFGYSMGRRSAESKAATQIATVAPPDTAAATRPKPSAVEVLRSQSEEPASTSDETSGRTVVVDQPAPPRDAEAPSPVATAQHTAAVKTPIKPV